MQESKLLFPQEIYSAYLTTINGIKLSKREIDIISCILNGRSAKGIAHLLSIAPKTVETHTYNVMKKLDCPSRENLISLVERSDKLLLLKKYYLRLLIHLAFEQTLKDMSKLGTNEEKSCTIVCWKEEERIALLSQIKAHLELVGVKVSLEIREKWQSLTYLISDPQSVYCILYALPQELGNKKSEGEAFEEKHPFSSKVLFLGFDKETFSFISPFIDDNRYINFAEKENYYFSVFTVLMRLFPQRNFDPLMEEFKKKHQFMTTSSEVGPLLNKPTVRSYRFLHLDNFLKQKKWLLCVLLLVCGGTLFYQGLLHPKEKEPLQNHIHLSETPIETIRSDLNLPNERIFLERPELMSQINDKLKSQAGIQTIALIGMGGAGKTTLARYYAHQQKAIIIWEINAETHESLQASFDHLAQALAKTEEDQEKLRELQGIKNSIEREKKVVQFVKEHLKAHSNWFLLYDNVEKFTDIHSYFPQDIATWGQGKVILTTRNSNIQNNKHINFSLFVGELDPVQKLNLFSYIMNNRGSSFFTPQQTEEVKAFLKNLPSFPLDISIAAYYLKSSNISYDQYLEKMHKYNQEFENVQVDLLKEAGDYTKTRYAIITLSLQQLIESHKDFKDLLLFISLIDSQNIPRELLERYKSSTIIDNFIHHLKKYSLITHESSPSLIPTFSIHRSTQAISLIYLSNMLNLKENRKILLPIVTTLDNYMANLVNREDVPKMKIIVSHCNALLNHDLLLNQVVKGSINTILGGIYSYLGDYVKAQDLLKEGLLNLKNSKDNKKENLKIAWVLEQLGSVYGELGNYKQAKDILEQSNLHYKSSSKVHLGLIRTTAELGYVYKELGYYRKAEDQFQRSLIMYEKYFPEDYVGIVWDLLYLGYLYQDLGNYEKAQYYYKKSLIVCQTHLPENHIVTAWVLSHLGNIERELGHYEIAKNLIEKALKTCQAHFPDNHVGLAVILAHLGKIYMSNNNYKEAKLLFNKSLTIFKNHYSGNHVRIGLVLRELAAIYLLENQLQKTEDFLNKANHIFQENNHPQVFVILEDLAELQLTKLNHLNNKEKIQQSEILKNQAITYFNQALKTINTRFPEDSPHANRIQLKLKELEKK
jgi:tetratricopeptide (TPR) repeat protein/DNA-binding CsgD family transcriptional regulator